MLGLPLPSLRPSRSDWIVSMRRQSSVRIANPGRYGRSSASSNRASSFNWRERKRSSSAPCTALISSRHASSLVGEAVRSCRSLVATCHCKVGGEFCRGVHNPLFFVSHFGSSYRVYPEGERYELYPKMNLRASRSGWRSLFGELSVTGLQRQSLPAKTGSNHQERSLRQTADRSS